jgi:alkanesulfonate monooxygenase SsuD/methylene tetrahydromethanopterin reductase-like flavin-dependent oxidoreductase (luciferase family)
MQLSTYYFIQAAPGRSATEIIREEVDQMVLSEALGFDAVWLTEHHYSDYGLSSAPSVLLATAAARTERIKFGLAVYVLPFHHPLRLAEETATLDILTGGRLIVGLGRGNRPIEFLGHGVPQDESRGRFEEAVEILLRAWSDEPVTLHGRHWSIENIPFYPKPASRPHPPIAFAVGSPQSIGWVGDNGYPLMTSGLFTTLPAILKQREAYVTALRTSEHDHSEEKIAELLARWVVTKHVYVAPTDAEARADAEGPERWYLDSDARSISPEGLPVSETTYRTAMDAVQRVRSLRWEELVETSLLIGSPATVRRKVEELEAAGVGELLCWMNFGGIPPEKARRSMRLFAEEVMPQFRRAPQAVGA